jgi:hypothetical protein
MCERTDIPGKYFLALDLSDLERKVAEMKKMQKGDSSCPKQWKKQAAYRKP